MTDFEKASQRAEELRSQLNYHSKRYYEMDAPEIEDYEYDMMLRELEELEERFPELITPDSPTHRVGGKADGQFTPVEHAVPMESLQDAFSFEEVFAFDKRVRAVVDNPSTPRNVMEVLAKDSDSTVKILAMMKLAKMQKS